MAQSTGTEVQNGQALRAAYQQAKALRPHGKGLSENNRAVLLVPPGRYGLGTSSLILDTEYVDVLGLSSSRENQYIFGNSNGPGTGVLMQTANNVRIGNLHVHCLTPFVVNPLGPNTPAAYYPDTVTTATVVTNCRFTGGSPTHSHMSMRIAVEYAGTYTDCVAEDFSFGGGTGIASGTFTNCSAGRGAYGGVQGTASGTFTNCKGGLEAFAGFMGTASGTFNNCIGGDSSFGGDEGVANGVFTNCTGKYFAFGGSGSAAGGQFIYCQGGFQSFGTNPARVLYCIRDGVAYP